ncbi:MAG: hypothetical protein IIB38_08625 [Candidatus Hydrogenedentes bacterium]|nr:hypothetical protein [Candidatus Hydrogenedentota bacterium]
MDTMRGMIAEPGRSSASIERVFTTVKLIFPFIITTWWMMIMVGNGVLAQRLLERRGWNKRPRPDLWTTALPPWPADASGSFGNTKRLSDVEHEALLDWIGQKYPKGEGEYTPTRDWSSEWRIGEPDHVFELGEYIIPEDVAEEIHEFKVTTNFDTDRWIVATEIKPTDTFLILEIDGGPLGAYHTGNGVTELPEGTGYLLKKGETVTVRVFYTKEKGWEEYDDSTRIGVVFAKDPAAIEKQLVVERMGNESFTIAAGSDSTDLSSEFIFPADGELVSVTPVVRMRGKSVRMMAVLPDGSHQPLLNIPYWDPSWHFTYELAEPLKAPKGTVVKMTANYDNSDMNARNPDATVDVSAGPNGEVLEGWIAYTLD